MSESSEVSPKMVRVIRKILELLDRRERWQLLGLFFLTLIMAFIQVLGIASVMPFMALLASPEMATENRWLRPLYEFGGFESTRQFTLFAGALVLAIFTISNALSATSSWLTYRFIQFTNYRLSARLLERYLSQPYSFFLERNSSSLTHRTLWEVALVMNAVVYQILLMATRAIVAVAILTLLLLVNTVLSIVVAVVLGGSYLLIYTLVKDRQHRLGRERILADEQKFKSAAEALGGIKESRVLGREPELLRRFSEAAAVVARTTTRQQVVAELPRYAIESLGLGGVILIALYLLATGHDIAGILPILSVYALAGYRLLPALQQIYGGASNLRFSVHSLDAVHEDTTSYSGQITTGQDTVHAGRAAQHQEIPFTREIRLAHIAFRYPDSKEWTLRDIDVAIPKNTSTAFVGSTGAGKTTLVDVILGLHIPDSGNVVVDDLALSEGNLRAWQRMLGYVPQEIFLSDDTVTRNIAFGLPDSQIDFDAVVRAAEAARVSEFIGGLPEGYDTLIGERGVRLSGGQRQRIGIARALYHDPEVLIMDEATSSLDGITENAVMEAIRALGRSKTIIVIAHRLATVEECDRLYMLENGRIVESGTHDELIRASDVFRRMAGHGDTASDATRFHRKATS